MVVRRLAELLMIATPCLRWLKEQPGCSSLDHGCTADNKERHGRKLLKNWNIENRAHKIISREKPKAAPTYDSTLQQIELVNKLEPDYKQKAQRKDQQLNDNLKKVYVTSNSTEIQEIDQRKNPNRPLPKDRLLHEDFPFGHYEPPEIKPGRISLRQAVELLSNRKTNPKKYTASYIAAEYKLEKEVVENILEYYSLFTVYNVEEGGSKDIVVSNMPISQTTGLTVRWSVDEKESEVDKLRKTFRNSSLDSMPVEEEKKKKIS
ncbi:protein NDUFAF4 homolog isoform X2 [Phymastichus coffea]|uniref:protein NDUFAF4 homolog isoform X2 n=1 Tax=Phymastichus coffea TaxID=108790 RepID=UPI00273B758A|nr:protein NDUFAF4 homolog isoform X2 [Phymastichus coffea]